MIAHEKVRLAARARAATLEVCTTGVMTLAASAVGGADPTYASYTREDGGSFLVDDFAVGMEVTPAGFASNVLAVIRKVTATVCSVERAPGATTFATEAAAGGRSLTVGLPSRRSYRNLPFTPVPGFPYVAELYTPGPSRRISVGPNGVVEALPIYSLNLAVPQNTETLAAERYIDALLAHFAIGQVLALGNGDFARVRGDAGPTPSQIQNDVPGWAIAPLTVPLRLRTTNAI